MDLRPPDRGPWLVGLALASALPAAAQEVELVRFTAPTQVTSGQSVRVSAEVKNHGPGDAEAFVAIRIGEGPTYAFSDPLLCYLPSLSQNYVLGVGESETSQADCGFPGDQPDATHLHARLIRVGPVGPNPRTTERSVAISVDEPVVPPTEPDLAAGSFTGPTSAPAGDPIGLSLRVRNDGDAASAPTTARFLLGVGGFNPADPRLCEVPVPAIGPKGDTMVIPSGCVVPPGTTPGSYTLHAEVNPTGASPDGNPGNERAQRPLQVTAPTGGGPSMPDPLPDLVVSSVEPPVQVVPGEPFTLRLTLRNLGSVDADNVTTIARWSTSDQPGSAEQEVGRDVGRLVPGGASPVSIAIEATTPGRARPGLAFLHVTVDEANQIEESNPDNNTRIAPVEVAEIGGDHDSGLLDDTAPDEPVPEQAPADSDEPGPVETVEFGCRCQQPAGAPALSGFALLLALGLRRRRASRP